MYEMFKSPHLILTPSGFVKDIFLKYYPVIRSKTTVLPLGIFPIKSEDRHPFHAKRPGEKMRFCYFGNILPIKGLHFLIDAFKALPDGKAILTIYGSRNPWTEAYYDHLKEKASGLPVDFPGPFKRENILEALRAQDVVILPSICPESFSFVIREAHYLKLPVIASRIGAIPEGVKEGVNGLLFEPGNVRELKDCMLRFIGEPDLVQRMAMKIPRIKTMEEHAAELSTLYAEIKGKKG
jgi:glycosyltransferase involved in cell wall biosynthesis